MKPSNFLIMACFAIVLFYSLQFQKELETSQKQNSLISDIVDKKITPKFYSYLQEKLKLAKSEDNTKTIQKPEPKQPSKHSKSNHCKAIGFFRDDTTTGSQIHQNTSQFCHKIKSTCCNQNDFEALKFWWEGDRNQLDSLIKETRYERRQRRIKMVLVYTKAIISNYNQYQKIARKIFHNENSSRICFEVATNFLSMKFNKSMIKDYEQNQKRCMASITKLQTSFMCSACDPEAQDSLDFHKGEIKLDEKTCDFLKEECSYSIHKNISQIYPYLKVVEPLVRCNQNGQITKRHQYLINDSRIIDLNYKEIKDIQFKFDSKICPKILTFGENLNLNSEGDAGYVLGIYMNSLEMFEIEKEFSKKIQQLNNVRQVKDELQNFQIKKANRQRMLFMEQTDFYKKKLDEQEEQDEVKERNEMADMARELEEDSVEDEQNQRLKQKESMQRPQDLKVEMDENTLRILKEDKLQNAIALKKTKNAKGSFGERKTGWVEENEEIYPSDEIREQYVNDEPQDEPEEDDGWDDYGEEEYESRNLDKIQFPDADENLRKTMKKKLDRGFIDDPKKKAAYLENLKSKNGKLAAGRRLDYVQELHYIWHDPKSKNSAQGRDLKKIKKKEDSDNKKDGRLLDETADGTQTIEKESDDKKGRRLNYMSTLYARYPEAHKKASDERKKRQLKNANFEKNEKIDQNYYQQISPREKRFLEKQEAHKRQQATHVTKPTQKPKPKPNSNKPAVTPKRNLIKNKIWKPKPNITKPKPNAYQPIVTSKRNLIKNKTWKPNPKITKPTNKPKPKAYKPTVTPKINLIKKKAWRPTPPVITKKVEHEYNPSPFGSVIPGVSNAMPSPDANFRPKANIPKNLNHIEKQYNPDPQEKLAAKPMGPAKSKSESYAADSASDAGLSAEDLEELQSYQGDRNEAAEKKNMNKKPMLSFSTNEAKSYFNGSEGISELSADDQSALAQYQGRSRLLHKISGEEFNKQQESKKLKSQVEISDAAGKKRSLWNEHDSIDKKFPLTGVYDKMAKDSEKKRLIEREKKEQTSNALTPFLIKEAIKKNNAEHLKTQEYDTAVRKGYPLPKTKRALWEDTLITLTKKFPQTEKHEQKKKDDIREAHAEANKPAYNKSVIDYLRKRNQEKQRAKKMYRSEVETAKRQGLPIPKSFNYDGLAKAKAKRELWNNVAALYSKYPQKNRKDKIKRDKIKAAQLYSKIRNKGTGLSVSLKLKLNKEKNHAEYQRKTRIAAEKNQQLKFGKKVVAKVLPEKKLTMPKGIESFRTYYKRVRYVNKVLPKKKDTMPIVKNVLPIGIVSSRPRRMVQDVAAEKIVEASKKKRQLWNENAKLMRKYPLTEKKGQYEKYVRLKTARGNLRANTMPDWENSKPKGEEPPEDLGKKYYPNVVEKAKNAACNKARTETQNKPVNKRVEIERRTDYMQQLYKKKDKEDKVKKNVEREVENDKRERVNKKYRQDHEKKGARRLAYSDSLYSLYGKHAKKMEIQAKKWRIWENNKRQLEYRDFIDNAAAEPTVNLENLAGEVLNSESKLKLDTILHQKDAAVFRRLSATKNLNHPRKTLQSNKDAEDDGNLEFDQVTGSDNEKDLIKDNSDNNTTDSDSTTKSRKLSNEHQDARLLKDSDSKTEEQEQQAEADQESVDKESQHEDDYEFNKDHDEEKSGRFEIDSDRILNGSDSQNSGEDKGRELIENGRRLCDCNTGEKLEDILGPMKDVPKCECHDINHSNANERIIEKKLDDDLSQLNVLDQKYLKDVNDWMQVVKQGKPISEKSFTASIDTEAKPQPIVQEISKTTTTNTVTKPLDQNSVAQVPITPENQPTTPEREQLLENMSSVESKLRRLYLKNGNTNNFNKRILSQVPNSLLYDETSDPRRLIDNEDLESLRSMERVLNKKALKVSNKHTHQTKRRRARSLKGDSKDIGFVLEDKDKSNTQYSFVENLDLDEKGSTGRKLVGNLDGFAQIDSASIEVRNLLPETLLSEANVKEEARNANSKSYLIMVCYGLTGVFFNVLMSLFIWN